MDEIKNFLTKIKKKRDFNKVKFVVLYGSYSKGKQNKMSDLDFCVYYDGSKKDSYKMRMRLLGELGDKYDVQMFKSLPLFLRKEVLRGKIVYLKDRKFIYDVAYSTIKEFDDFKKHYYLYINNERKN